MKALTILFILTSFSCYSQVKLIKKINQNLKIIENKKSYFLANKNNKTIEVLSINKGDKIGGLIVEKIPNQENLLKLTYTISTEENNSIYMSRLKLRKVLYIDKMRNLVTLQVIEFIDFEKLEVKTKEEFNFFYSISANLIDKNSLEVSSFSKNGNKENIHVNYLKDFLIFEKNGEGKYTYVNKSLTKL